MAINPVTAGIHHICLRSVDFTVTKNFYQNILGFQLAIDTPDLIIFAAAGIYLAFKKADPRNKEYSQRRVQCSPSAGTASHRSTSRS